MDPTKETKKRVNLMELQPLEPSGLDTLHVDLFNALPGVASSAEGNELSRVRKMAVKPTVATDGAGNKVPIKEEWILCGKVGCPGETVCCLGKAGSCCGSGFSARWFHISLTEHVCNSCYEYFYRGGGQDLWHEWEMGWAAHADSKPLVISFLCYEQLPYWIRCTAPNCGKWRKVNPSMNVTPDIIGTFRCGDKTTHDATCCADPEDEAVSEVMQNEWWTWCSHSALLEHSPAAAFLPHFILPDRAGLSFTRNTLGRTSHAASQQCSFLEPFSLEPNLDPNLEPIVVQGRFSMDKMEELEKENFDHLLPTHAPTYLAIRNLVMALWASNITEWLTKEKCVRHLICRGMIRVRLELEVENVLWFLTSRGIINCGLLTPPPSHIFMAASNQQCHVVVVGAGASGLAAAKFLQDFNVKVTVLEAGKQIGGRVQDVISSGVAVGQGAQLLNNLTNNPLSLACFQGGLKLREIGEECTLFRRNGQLVPHDVSHLICCHFQKILNSFAHWRCEKALSQDVSIEEPVSMLQTRFEELFVVAKGLKRELALMEFFKGNLECALGAPLDRVSAMCWDQYEETPQFSGTVGLVEPGYQQLLQQLASGLNIYFSTQVRSIDYSSEKVVVQTTMGDLQADKVIVTVPLTVLKSGVLQFNPPLPPEKIAAIQALGAGQQEKEDGSQIVVGVTGGHALSEIEDKTDEEVMAMAMGVLRRMFPQETIPEPCWYLVTHWGTDPLIGMSFSYLPVGVDGSTYDAMAKCVGERIHFAGEATNRQFPQTVTGAYLSGIREASFIVSQLHRGD